ncbi:MAG: S9 family peptidase [Acidobacteriota bacterium]
MTSPQSPFSPSALRPAGLRRPAAGFPAALAVLLALLLPALSSAAEPPEPGDGDPGAATLDVSRWLMVGPAGIRLPAFHGDASYSLGDWLLEPSLDLEDRWPEDGGAAPWPAASGAAWRAMAAPDNVLTLDTGEHEGPAAAWLATWIDADRFTEATLRLESPHLLRVLLNGEQVAIKKEAGEAKAEVTAELHLDTGHHRLMVLAVKDPEAEDPWTLEASLSTPGALASSVRFATRAERPLALDDLLEPPRANSVDLSRGGRFLAVGMRSSAAPTDTQRTWIDIYETASGRLVHTLQRQTTAFQWSPAEESGFLFAAANPAGGHDLVLGTVGEGAQHVVSRAVEDFAGVRFADADTLILTVRESEEAETRPAKRYRDLPDRWSGRRDRSHLYALELDGTRTRLTVASTFDQLQDVHPDGTRLLISRQEHGRLERPFSATTLVELNLATLEPRSVVQMGWFGSALYSPDGASALVLGSPALFGGAGEVVEGRIANDYDTQAYRLDLATGQAKALSRDLDPNIQEAVWPHEGEPYLRVEDRSWHRLMKLSDGGVFEEIPTGSDTVGGGFDVALSDGGETTAWLGSGVNDPHAVWLRRGGESRRLVEPSADRLEGVRFGETRDWSFTSKAGDEILGRVYLPPGLDPEAEKSYPLIVYYYGGTSPVGRGFGGRYPKEWWAAQGYVVYVLQPSGATGFGQEFSSRHVGAWGRQTADEILEGTEQFLEAHGFIDPERVGAIGASYGGFMTLYLQTQSEIFSAAVSHAGISNISSYWGRGWWGYLYSAAASAESFPWNDRDLYVGQSPLYQADKITTPVLLLHGTADVNVPPSESHQMYTALKVLGREVELIEIEGSNHTILNKEKRRLWSRSILAWFDRYLKDQPEMWQHMWGTENEPKG